MKVLSCCGLISLKTGTITIGVLSLISTVICSINLSVELYKLSAKPSRPRSDHDGLSDAIDLGLGMIVLALLILTLIDIAVNVYMIIGTFKKIPGYIFPWLALHFGGIICAICMCTAVTIISVVSFSIGAFFLVFLVTGSACTLIIYFWLVVYSHYKDVIAESFGQQGRPNDGKIFAAIPIPYRNI